MKNYELIIEACHTDNEKIYRSKGHHKPEDFMKALREYGESSRFTVPEHVYTKTTPTNPDSWCSCHYYLVDKSVRGAYPATYVYEYIATSTVINFIAEEEV